MLNHLPAIVGLALLAIVIYDFITAYRASTKTGRDRLWDAGRGSAVIVWQQFGLVIAGATMAATSVVDWVCQFLGAPGADEAIKSVIGTMFTPAKVGAALAIYAAVSVAARLRSLKKSV